MPHTKCHPCYVSWRNARKYNHEEGQNVTFLKEIEDYKNRPGTKIYLVRQENDEVVCSPAEQVPKAG